MEKKDGKITQKIYLWGAIYWGSNLVFLSIGSYKNINVLKELGPLKMIWPLLYLFIIIITMSAKKVILGCSNIWDNRKGLTHFIELSKKIQSDYQIVLIGKTKEKLPDNIIHIPRTDSIETLSKWYSLSYVFFNPTQMENFPTVNIESLACGTPIVTFGKGGSGEVVDNQVGKIVQNVDEFLHILETIDFEEMNQFCVEKSKNYQSKKMVDNYINLYFRISKLSV